MVTKKLLDELSYEIIGCAIKVHKALVPGLLESIYEKCLVNELMSKDFRVVSQIKVPINYKGLQLDADLRLDILVENLIVVEVKAVETINALYEAQILSYMRLLEKPKGILINFCCKNIFKEGQRTFVNDLYNLLPSV
jgi:GxxExxY protein